MSSVDNVAHITNVTAETNVESGALTQNMVDRITAAINSYNQPSTNLIYSDSISASDHGIITRRDSDHSMLTTDYDVGIDTAISTCTKYEPYGYGMDFFNAIEILMSNCPYPEGSAQRKIYKEGATELICILRHEDTADYRYTVSKEKNDDSDKQSSPPKDDSLEEIDLVTDES